ncbi:hypothetical protein D3C76_1536380 [compost metagenome]
MRFVHDRRTLMVDNHYQRCFRQGRIYAGRRRMTMQVVLKDDNAVSRTRFEFA